MDDQGRLIIPAPLRKDGKPFIGATYKETGVDKESPTADVERKIKELEAEIRAQRGE